MKNLFLSIQLFGFSLFAVAQNAPIAFINIQQPELICTQGNCIELTTEYLTTRSTTDYVINSIPYSPLFPFTGGTILNATGDDIWTSKISLPFNFCFFGNTFNSLLVGSNGVLTFDLTNNLPSGYCIWPFTQTIPNVTFPIRNAIYGVYQDSDIRTPPVTNPQIQNVNFYILDTGVNVAPNRVFVVNFNELPQFSCNNSVGLQTSQIILYETTNIIDINVKSRTSCIGWNSGSGLIGIQNQEGTLAYTPPLRNTGTWSTNNEAWRIYPNGSDLPLTFLWYNNGNPILDSFNNSLLVCPTPNDNYSVRMSIPNCDNSLTILESNTVNQLVVPDPGFNDPFDILFCTESPFVYVANLNVNAIHMLSGTASPSNYIVTYYENLSDAENGTSNYITNSTNYSFAQNKTIYAVIEENFQTGCRYLKQFQLIIEPTVAPPTGNASQNFLAEQTLASLQVTGENIIWYDASTNGNVLPSTTLLVDNTTYYASQIVNGCESNRSVNSNRLAVTAHLVLSNTSFASSSYLVYPNPVGDFVTVSNEETINSIAVYNTLGQEVMALFPNEKEIKISTSKLYNGVYFIKIVSGNKSKTVKISKE